jgi:hypothetical protein
MVCAAPKVDGEEKPQFMKTWDYTERTLVPLKIWKQHANAEMMYRRGSKYKGWAFYSMVRILIKSGLVTIGKAS